MALYAIGDLQGCYDELRQLLDRVNFDPVGDKLWFVGDLVNRGPHSLEVIRFIKGLGKQAVTVLGNHDLHLLALSVGQLRHKGQDDHTLDPILYAGDRDELLHWLRNRPLMHYSKKYRFSLIHAGLAPQWTIETAAKLAREVEATLQGDGFHDFCYQMYGNKPSRWSNSLKGMERLRFITNCFTRLRYCDVHGNLALKESGRPGTQHQACIPWFQVPTRASRHNPILFGHWSTLGYHQSNNIWALDSGCLWGGKLTAVKVREKKPPAPIQINCPKRKDP